MFLIFLWSERASLLPCASPSPVVSSAGLKLAPVVPVPAMVPTFVDHGSVEDPVPVRQILVDPAPVRNTVPVDTVRADPLPIVFGTEHTVSGTNDGAQSMAALLRQEPLQWGAYAGAYPENITRFESLVGSRADLVATFYGWYDDFPLHYGSVVRDDGKTLVIFWEQYGVTLDEIISGGSDAYIRKFAQDASRYGGPVLLAPLHEMNGYWTPWSGVHENNSAQKVILAWRHIHDLFRDAPNVRFVWAVNSDSVPNTEANAIAAYYPGDAYVDAVAINGFNFGDPWMSFDMIFRDTLLELKLYHKPIYILSIASRDGPGKAAWITDALTVGIPRHPEIVGWIWFNENKEANWTVNSDADSLKAFQNALDTIERTPLMNTSSMVF